MLQETTATPPPSDYSQVARICTTFGDWQPKDSDPLRLPQKAQVARIFRPPGYWQSVDSYPFDLPLKAEVDASAESRLLFQLDRPQVPRWVDEIARQIRDLAQSDPSPDGIRAATKVVDRAIEVLHDCRKLGLEAYRAVIGASAEVHLWFASPGRHVELAVYPGLEITFLLDGSDCADYEVLEVGVDVEDLNEGFERARRHLRLRSEVGSEG